MSPNNPTSNEGQLPSTVTPMTQGPIQGSLNPQANVLPTGPAVIQSQQGASQAVAAAKMVLQQAKGNPYRQSLELQRIKSKYVLDQFGIELKVVES